jgi:nicotinate-nucleotide--dimethylbenzimidazole phosphoribosyltransferase
LEIGAMAGAMLEAAARRRLVVVDGYISAAAALLAVSINPLVREYMVLGHLSAEPGHRAAAGKLELRPLLDLGLRLGEGTGAALAMTIIESARDALAGMSTLAEAGIVLPTAP